MGDLEWNRGRPDLGLHGGGLLMIVVGGEVEIAEKAEDVVTSARLRE